MALGPSPVIDPVIEFTVALRTYNAASRLPVLLEALQTQQKVGTIHWEILVVDNNSTDATVPLLIEWSSRGLPGVPLRWYQEPRQGAVHARQKAIQEARGAWIGFLDDDNVPTEDWVANSVAFVRQNPGIGACGSQIHGVFEGDKPQDFDRIAHFLAIIERPHAVCFTRGMYARKQVLPPGAGLVIRRQAWLDTVPERLSLNGPIGKSLATKGEDTEALSHLKNAGWEIWFNPQMRIHHHIQAHRLRREYLLPFFQGIGRGRHHTRMLGYEPWLRPAMTVFYGLNDLRKLVTLGLKKGWRVPTDLVVACEWQLHWSSLWSPLQSIAIWRSRLAQSRLAQSRLAQSHPDQSRLDQSRLDQSRLDQSRLDQSRLAPKQLPLAILPWDKQSPLEPSRDAADVLGKPVLGESALGESALGKPFGGEPSLAGIPLGERPLASPSLEPKLLGSNRFKIKSPQPPTPQALVPSPLTSTTTDLKAIVFRVAQLAGQNHLLTKISPAITQLDCTRLGYADLGYADLSYADLGYADLGYADLGPAENALPCGPIAPPAPQPQPNLRLSPLASSPLASSPLADSPPASSPPEYPATTPRVPAA